MNKLRWISLALAVSIALNLAFVGMMVGRHFGGMCAMGPPPGEQRAIDRLAKDMSADGGEKLRAVLMPRSGQLQQQRADERRTRDDVRTAMSANPFDRARLESAMAAHRASTAALQQTIQSGLADAASQLSPEDRAKLAESGRRPMRGGPPGP